MKRIILASKSAGRREVMERLGLPFEIQVSTFEEDMSVPLSPEELAIALSLGKAKEVAARFPDAVVIGADTFVVFEGKLLGKPKDADDAKQTLRSLSGKTHSVMTGFTIAEGARLVSRAMSTFITFRSLGDAEIDAYVATGEALSKAGSYAIQGGAAGFVEKVVGDQTNVMGLPLEAVKELLVGEFGIPVRS